MDFILHFTFLLLSFGGLLFLPGFVALRILLGKASPLSSWETLLTAFALSIGLLDFLMILLGKNDVIFTRYSISLAILATLYLFFVMRRIHASIAKKKEAPNQHHSAFAFTTTQGKLFLLIIFLTLFTKSIFLSNAAFPTSTDLGHHMYWSKLVAMKGALPEYSKIEIEVSAKKCADCSGPVEMISPPEPIADFIIGEHLPFGALAIFSGNDFISAFPVITLFLVSILSLLASFVLAIRFGEEIQKKFSSFVPMHFGLIVLFLLGPLYTLASPQAKFVSGGVVGNTFGNFFIPVILLFFFRSIREKNPLFLGLAFFFTFTLAYTHHLSTLVLLFILIGSIFMLITLHRDSIRELLMGWMKLLRHPFPLSIAITCIIFFFAIAMPTYIETHAVSTAIGTPTKLTRIGLTFSEVLSGSGEARATLGIAGILILLIFSSAYRYSAGILIGWAGILLIMSLKPSLVFLDIPSNRIGSYALFPLTFLAGFVILLIPEFFRNIQGKIRTAVPPIIPIVFILVIFTYSIGSGSADNGGSLLSAPKSDAAVETFAVSRFLSERIGDSGIVLKDHNYLSADSFMKLFFMRDYGFPLSRGYFKRYETPGHEQCSLVMISSPNTPAGKKCFDTTRTDIVVVNPLFDRIQFEKSENFSRIYSSPLIHTYTKKSDPSL